MKPNYILAIIIPILCISTILVLIRIHDSSSPSSSSSSSSSSAVTSHSTTSTSSTGQNIIHFKAPDIAQKPQTPILHTQPINPSSTVPIVKETSNYSPKNAPVSSSSSTSNIKTTTLPKPQNIHICSQDVVNRLAKPRLSEDDIAWCKYALSASGGRVQVGKSWGNLKKPEQQKFDKLDCNTVSTGKNPSCDDTWGDKHVQLWRKTPSQSIDCNPSPSSIQCYQNENNDEYCIFNHVQIDYSKMRQVPNAISGKPSRAFQKDFMTIACSATSNSYAKELKGFKMDHLFSVSSSQSCELFIPGTTVLYSHDNIRNMGHTWQDIVNVWLLLWLEKLAPESEQRVQFLTIDALRQYNYFDDVINEFYFFYQHHFANISSPKTYKVNRVCYERLITQPLPSRGFVWDSWNQDLPCSFVGPSTLYQRFNYHIRSHLGFLQHTHPSQLQEKIKVLVIVRSETTNDWGSYRTGRLYKNLSAMKQQLNALVGKFNNQMEIITQDFKDIPKMKDQLEFISQVGIIIGMHGAGIVHSMHMSVGTKHCCGVIEMFPKGEFTPVRGHGNMIRKMGIYYDRIDISETDSHSDGAIVPVDELSDKLSRIIDQIQAKSSCILPQVIDDPFLLRD